MSKSNYRRCVGLGVTGQKTSTCFPASVDKILPQCRVEAEYYRYYDKIMKGFDKLPNRQKNPVLNNLYKDLQESIDSDELIFHRIVDLEQLREVVKSAMRDRLGIVIDVKHGEDTHSLGLESVNRKLGHFTLSSTHVPHSLRGVVTLGYVFPHIVQLDEPYRVRYPFNNANVTIVPA